MEAITIESSSPSLTSFISEQTPSHASNSGVGGGGGGGGPGGNDRGGGGRRDIKG